VSIQLNIYANYTFISGTFDPAVVDQATRFRKSGYRYSSGFKARGWDGYTRLFSKPKSAFPTGLKDRVIRIYKKKYPKSVFDLQDHRCFKKTKKITKTVPDLVGITLRPHQLRACNSMLRKKHGVLWASTNSGKTECAIAVIKTLNLPTLFLVKGKDLVVQTYERFKSRLGDDADVGLVMADTWDVRKFTVASADTLARRFNPTTITTKSSENQRKVRELLDDTQVMIIDECHTSAATGLWNIGRYCKASYRFGLSGTPFKRGDKQDLKLIALTGEVCCKITNKEMIEHGISTPTEIKFVEMERPKLQAQLEYVDAYDLGISNNIYRNHVICRAAQQFYDAHKNVLIIVKNISHGNLLDRMLDDFKPEAFMPHKFIHGDTPLEERTEAIHDFKNGLFKVLITSSILDQGVDIPNIDVLIFAAGGKSYIRAIQRVGRGLRVNDGKDKLTVIDFCDKTHRYLAKHSIERISAYSKEDCFTMSFVDEMDV
jgi:superfamily II DNA or RNA helicase